MQSPRLELRWQDKDRDEDGYTCECIYSLVIPLRKLDIRRERYGEDGEPLPDREEIAAEICRTRSTGAAIDRVRDGEVDTPFRDGAHARWDAEALGGLPIYAIAGDVVRLVRQGA